MYIYIYIYGTRSRGYGAFSTKLLSEYPYNSIIKLSICWCVWKVREKLPCWV